MAAEVSPGCENNLCRLWFGNIRRSDGPMMIEDENLPMTEQPTRQDSRATRAWLLGMSGACAGGIVGLLVFGLALKVGVYGLAVIGVGVGMGCIALARQRTWSRAVACGLIAAAFSVYADWSNMPFVKDDSFGFYLAHWSEVHTMAKIMTPLSAIIAAMVSRPVVNPTYGDR